MDMIMI